MPNPSGSGGAGLERSCAGARPDWIHQSDVVDGVELLAASLQGLAYRMHRHDTYAIGLTERGVQAFTYRGSTHTSAPGQVVVLHPDEPHDGRAGGEAGFAYRLLYVDPGLIFEAARELSDKAVSWPFFRYPVVTSPRLAAAIRAAFHDPREPLQIDDVVMRLAEGLLEADPGGRHAPTSRHVDVMAIERARHFLETEMTRVVRSWELEAVSGLSRYELARQFRQITGTSPYRYLLMRRLSYARGQIVQSLSLVDVALESGFADQAHFTRQFTAAFGFTPAQYRALRAPGQA